MYLRLEYIQFRQLHTLYRTIKRFLDYLERFGMRKCHRKIGQHVDNKVFYFLLGAQGLTSETDTDIQNPIINTCG